MANTQDKAFRPIYEAGKFFYIDPRIPFEFPDYLGGTQWITDSTEAIRKFGIEPMVLILKSEWRSDLDGAITELKRDPAFPEENYLIIGLQIFNGNVIKFNGNVVKEDSTKLIGRSGKSVSIKYPWLSESALSDNTSTGPFTGIFAAALNQYPKAWHREIIKFVIDRIAYFLAIAKDSPNVPVTSIPSITLYFDTPTIQTESLNNWKFTALVTLPAFTLILLCSLLYHPCLWVPILFAAICSSALSIFPARQFLKYKIELRKLENATAQNLHLYSTSVTSLTLADTWCEEASWRCRKFRIDHTHSALAAGSAEFDMIDLSLQKVEQKLEHLKELLASAINQYTEARNLHDQNQSQKALQLIVEPVKNSEGTTVKALNGCAVKLIDWVYAEKERIKLEIESELKLVESSLKPQIGFDAEYARTITT